MSKQIAPDISLQSFCCPHCDANAHQDWHQTYAIREENNKPHVLYPSDVEQIFKNTDFGEQEIPEEILEDFERKGNGEVFFYKFDRWQSAPFKVENLWISQCYSCKQIAFWIHDKMIWPISTAVEMPNEDMPSDVKTYFEEARQIFGFSPKASAALLRLCVEMLCNHLKAEGDSLNKKIGKLVEKGLNPKVQMMLDAVRVIGNESVHPGQINLNDDRSTAVSLFKIVNRIVEELITEEQKIKEIFDILPEGAKKAIEKRDKKAS